ncbi:NAD(P)H-dependent oxidoreductase [Candidatus Saccharibacteria bacterium]|nr:NAD(P)H-dependent oxidoreductase [Candidatus Saccharibacteria bacterium]
MNKINQEIKKAFLFRHASKDFDRNKKVSDEDFRTIIESAHLSPSSYGFEPWKFLVVQNPEIREKLREQAWGGQNQIPHSSHLVVILARRGQQLLPESDYIQSTMRDMQQLPENIIEMKTQKYGETIDRDFMLKTDREKFDWAKRQTYIPLTNMMTVASLLGIDSCPMEGFNESAIDKVLESECGVDLDQFGISVMVAFGYRTAEPRPKTRYPIDKVVKYF